MPGFCFNGPKRPSDNCNIILFLVQKNTGGLTVICAFASRGAVIKYWKVKQKYLEHSIKLYFVQWKYLQCTCILQELLMYTGRELQIISGWNWFWPYYFPQRGKYEINLDLSWIFDQKYYGNIERGGTNMIVTKVEYPKYYSKHWPHLLAATMDCIYCRILKHGLYYGLCLSRFGWK